ncbi:MAG: peptidylprolyl isomerase [Anaerolineae bacterium]|nr:peptidylprolyl isomerase [Anaerolineae bacterium]
MCAEVFPAPEPESRTFTQAEQVLEDGVDYRAVFCTSAGPIYIDLFEEQTPITVNNFVFLSQQGYYNNTHFHRVIPDFMAQGGDPTNTGTGGPGYDFEDEFVDELVFDRPGLLAMANAGPATNGSQFFITTVPTEHLNGAHTIFGEVLTGQENVESIRLRDPQQSFGPGTMIYTIVIVENPDNVPAEEAVFDAPALEDAQAAFENINTLVPLILEKFFPGLTEFISVADTNVVPAEEAASLVSEANQAAAEAYYADHNLQYSAFTSVTNGACNLTDFPVQQMSFKIDSYASLEDAAAALEDERLTEMLITDGFAATEAPEVPFGVFTRTAEGCDGSSMVEAVGLWQQGYAVITGQIVLTQDNAQIAAPLLTEFVQQLYEEVLYPLLQPRVE